LFLVACGRLWGATAASWRRRARSSCGSQPNRGSGIGVGSFKDSRHSEDRPSDGTVQEHIESLVAEEHRLLETHSDGGLSSAEHERLEQVRVELDRIWDLLRQRRARRDAGLDPDDASERDAGTVERYLG
jgi:Protein of unknown function (DUF2630)